MSTMYVNNIEPRDAAAVTFPNKPAFRVYGVTNSPVNDVWTSAHIYNKIIWPNTRYNIGNHYNPTNGIFTAPVKGLYKFEVFVWTNNTNAGIAQVVIAKNNWSPSNTSESLIIAEGRVSPSSTGQSQYTRIVCTGTDYLNEGDIVFAACGNENTNMHISTNDRYSNFSGYLIG